MKTGARIATGVAYAIMISDIAITWASDGEEAGIKRALRHATVTAIGTLAGNIAGFLAAPLGPAAPFIGAGVKEYLLAKHFVYVLVDPETGAMRYVGRTIHPKIRAYQHSVTPGKRGLEFRIVQRNLTYAQARGVEQILLLMKLGMNLVYPIHG